MAYDGGMGFLCRSPDIKEPHPLVVGFRALVVEPSFVLLLRALVQADRSVASSLLAARGWRGCRGFVRDLLRDLQPGAAQLLGERDVFRRRCRVQDRGRLVVLVERPVILRRCRALRLVWPARGGLRDRLSPPPPVGLF